MPTLDIRITWIMDIHITSGFDLAVHVVRLEPLPARSVVLLMEAPRILGSNTYNTKFDALQHRCSTIKLLRRPLH